MLLQAQETMKRHYDTHKNTVREYKKGDQVWLEGTNIKMDRPMKKLDNKWHGPFPIVKKVGESALCIQAQTSSNMDRVEHGYTAGQIFQHRTRTLVHRDPYLTVIRAVSNETRGLFSLKILYIGIKYI